jgi:hypothetical protein
MSHFSSDYTDTHGRPSGERALPVVTHDYGRHPFQVQLSRELARCAMDVLHLHCDSVRIATGAVDDADDEGLRVEGSFSPKKIRQSHHRATIGKGGL